MRYKSDVIVSMIVNAIVIVFFLLGFNVHCQVFRMLLSISLFRIDETLSPFNRQSGYILCFVIVDIIVFYCLVLKILCSLQTGKVRLGEAAYPRFMGWASGNASL